MTAHTHSEKSPRGTIAVVGSINVDVFARVQRHPSPGETVHGTGGHTFPGGKGANQAVAAALLGGSVSMVGAVGSDAYAPIALTSLRDAGVAVDAVRHVQGPTGLALVTVSHDGENSIVVIGGANDSMDADAVHRSGAVIENAAIVVAQGEIPVDGGEAILAHVRGRFVLNPAPVQPLAREVFLAADPLVVNEHEAALVLEHLGVEASADDPRAAGEALINEGVRSVVVTLGAQGALVCERSHPDDEVSIEQIPPVRVEAVDSTGAGDAFIGGLCVKLSEGESLTHAARFAARVGAFAVTKEGAQPSYPSLSDSLPE